MEKIDIENLYFHGLAGGIPFWDEDIVTSIALKQLRDIIEKGGIYSRKILRKKYGIHYDEKEPVYNGEEYISVCKKNPENNEFSERFVNTDPAFFRYVRFKIGIALNSNIVDKCKFREGEYKHLPGERQILDSIDISNFIAIIVGLENKTRAISEIENILEGKSIPIVDFRGNIITNIEKKEDIEIEK